MVFDPFFDRFVVAILAALSLGACSSSDGGSGGETVHFTPLERQSTVVESLSEPASPVDLEDRPSYMQIIEGFRNNATSLFQRQGIEQRLDQIERVFVGTGKYLELVAIYQDAYETLGVESPVAERLAFSYIRLGQPQQARELIDEMLEARPEDPGVAFLDGSYWMSVGSKSPENLARAAVRWKRVLELDSDFQGFGRASAQSLRRQIRQIESRLPQKPEAIVERVGAKDAADDGGSDTPAETAETRPKSEDGGDDSGSETVEQTASDSAESDGGTSEEATGGESERADTDSRAKSDASGPAETEKTATDDEPERTPTGVLMMRADEALDSDDGVAEAKRRYAKVLAREPGHVGARMGLLRAKWKENPDDPALVDQTRELAKSDELTARQAYELVLFAKVRLKDSELADTLRERVREIDPGFAAKVGID